MNIKEMETKLQKAEGVDICGLMELLYEQHSEIGNYLVDLHEATTALGGPGGTLSEVRKALYTISDHTLLAATILNTYQEEHPEEK